MTTKPTRSLKIKPLGTASHNPDIANQVAKMNPQKEVPFQVMLPEPLAKKVKQLSVDLGVSYKAVTIEALEAHLRGQGIAL
jgi:hypothetical protein